MSKILSISVRVPISSKSREQALQKKRIEERNGNKDKCFEGTEKTAREVEEADCGRQEHEAKESISQEVQKVTSN